MNQITDADRLEWLRKHVDSDEFTEKFSSVDFGSLDRFREKIDECMKMGMGFWNYRLNV